MTSKFIAGALAGALFFGVSASPSHALTFQFSFANIHGLISGLEDNSVGQAADSVAVTVSPTLGGLGEYVPGDNFFQSFDVSGGAITAASFQSTVGDFSLLLGINPSLSLFNGTLFNEDEEHGLNGILSYSLVAETTPLPAALPLFATGLGALGLLGWRRKRKQAA
jgi:hypothetical protein